MNYNYETIRVDIEALKKCSESLKTDRLKQIALSAHENFTQIAITIALPHFLMTQSVLSIKHFQYLLEGAVATKSNIQPKTEEGKKQLDDFVDLKFKENNKIHSEEGRQLLNKLRSKNPFLENAIRTQALNSLVNTWTIFESTSKDIWIFLLNDFQNLFLNNILESKTDEEIEGITGKLISISFLGKYGFNVNNKLGDILSGKYDFTSCAGIKRAFVDLNKIKKEVLNFLDNRDLFQLEVIRNLVVHKAGVIDDVFLKKSSFSKELLGSKIIIDTSDYEKYETSAIQSLVKLLEFSDETCS